MNITPDALPLPGPVWLFELLLHFTFVLHLLAMNFLVGGAMIAIVSRLRGAMDLARWIETKLPAAMAFTVTLGVAPLLFVQALYGHLFYTSSVLMAWPWFSVLLILLVTYALVYRVAWHGESGAAKVLLLLINLFLLFVGRLTAQKAPEAFVDLVINVNEILRSLGQPDAYPFVITDKIAAKLELVHQAVLSTVRSRH